MTTSVRLKAFEPHSARKCLVPHYCFTGAKSNAACFSVTKCCRQEVASNLATVSLTLVKLEAWASRSSDSDGSATHGGTLEMKTLWCRYLSGCPNSHDKASRNKAVCERDHEKLTSPSD